jgi:hypothetical protein
MAQAELPTPWMLVMEVLIDEKGLIDQQSTRFQRANEMWKERPMQIQEDEDSVIPFLAKIRRVRGFQVQCLRRDASEVSGSSVGQQLCERLFISVNGLDLVPER